MVCLRAWGLEFLRFRVSGSMLFRDQDLGFRVWGFLRGGRGEAGGGNGGGRGGGEGGSGPVWNFLK